MRVPLYTEGCNEATFVRIRKEETKLSTVSYLRSSGALTSCFVYLNLFLGVSATKRMKDGTTS